MSLITAVISFENNKVKVLSCNLYQAIHILRDTKFVVFTVTEKQYERLLEVVRLKSVDDIL